MCSTGSVGDTGQKIGVLLSNLINEDGAWQQVLRNKYLSNKWITQVDKKRGDSKFWTGLMNVKNQFLSFGNYRLQDGKQVRF